MKITKINLANLQGKLSRIEMKTIMAGSGNSPYGNGICGNFCNTYCSWPHPCGQTDTNQCKCFS